MELAIFGEYFVTGIYLCSLILYKERFNLNIAIHA